MMASPDRLRLFVQERKASAPTTPSEPVLPWPSFVITHRASLEQGPELYKTFRDKQDGCIKVVMKP